MKIKVTKEHIKAGRRKSACYCPVALAVTEAVGSLAYVCQDRINTFKKDYNHDYQEYTATNEVAEFIHSFDNNGSPDPFEFELVQVEGD